jgi:CRISPR/Cas system-associated exonuclease Cas4 (RecB family)
MVNDNHKENENLHWKHNEEETRTVGGIGLQDRMIHSEIGDTIHISKGNTAHTVEETDKVDQMHSIDLGGHYIACTIDAMEKWHSKPREGNHVTDVVMCPRQRVYREIDRLPIDAKTVGIYSAGKAIHEAIQLLFMSDKRTFEREKYIEYEDIQGSVDVYDRRRNIPLEFKTTRASDIKEPKSFHVEQLKYYMSILDAEQGYMLYQLLMHFGDTPFKAFKITMNALERRNQRKKLVTEINSLKKAIEKGNPSMARSVEKDPSLNWLCKDCPYLTDCKKIQQGATGAA